VQKWVMCFLDDEAVRLQGEYRRFFLFSPSGNAYKRSHYTTGTSEMEMDSSPPFLTLWASLDSDSQKM
jgi:hypothetical protein